MTMFSDSYQIDHIPLAGTSDRYQEQIPSDRLLKKTVTVQGGAEPVSACHKETTPP